VSVLFGEALPQGSCVTEYGGGFESHVEQEARECLANHWGREGAMIALDYQSHKKRLTPSDCFGGVHSSSPVFNGKPDFPGNMYNLAHFLRNHEYVSTSISALPLFEWFLVCDRMERGRGRVSVSVDNCVDAFVCADLGPSSTAPRTKVKKTWKSGRSRRLG